MTGLRSIGLALALLPAIAPVTCAQDKNVERVVRIIARSEPKHLRSRNNLAKILRNQPNFWIELQGVAERLKTQPEWLLNKPAS